MENMKNLCAPIPEALHAQVMQEKDQLGQTLSEYVQQVLNEHFNGKDGKAMDKNFIVYIVIGIIATLAENICISKKADKLYPFLLNKESDDLSKNEKSKIFSNVKSLVIYKFGGIIMNGTDNILISYLINVSTVGLCSNYIMIISAIKSILSNALNSCMHK